MARFVPILAMLAAVALCASAGTPASNTTADSNVRPVTVDAGVNNGQETFVCPSADLIREMVTVALTSMGMTESAVSVSDCKVAQKDGKEFAVADIKLGGYACALDIPKVDATSFNSTFKHLSYEFSKNVQNCQFQKTLNESAVKPVEVPTSKPRKCKGSQKVFDFVIDTYNANISEYMKKNDKIPYDKIKPSNQGCVPGSESKLGGTYSYDLSIEKCVVNVESINDDLNDVQISEETKQAIARNLEECVDGLIENYGAHRAKVNSKKRKSKGNSKSATEENNTSVATEEVQEEAVEAEIAVTETTETDNASNVEKTIEETPEEEIKEEIQEEVVETPEETVEETVEEEIKEEIQEETVETPEETVEETMETPNTITAEPIKKSGYTNKGNCNMEKELFSYITNAYDNKYRNRQTIPGGINFKNVNIKLLDCEAGNKVNGGMYTFSLNDKQRCSIRVETNGTKLPRNEAEHVAGQLNRCMSEFQLTHNSMKRDARAAKRSQRDEDDFARRSENMEPRFSDDSLFAEEVQAAEKLFEDKPTRDNDDDGFITVKGRKGFAQHDDTDFNKSVDTEQVDIDEDDTPTISKKTLENQKKKARKLKNKNLKKAAEAEAKRNEPVTMICDGENFRGLLDGKAFEAGVTMPKQFAFEKCAFVGTGETDRRFGFVLVNDKNRKCDLSLKLRKDEEANANVFVDEQAQQEFADQVNACVSKFDGDECTHKDAFFQIFKSVYVRERRYVEKSNRSNITFVGCRESADSTARGLLTVDVDGTTCDIRMDGLILGNRRASITNTQALSEDVVSCIKQVDAHIDEQKKIENVKALEELARSNKALDDEFEAKTISRRFSRSQRENSIVVPQTPSKITTDKPKKALIGAPRVRDTEKFKAIATQIYAKLAALKLIKSQFVSTQNVESVETQLVAGTNYNIMFSFNNVKCQLQVFEGLPSKDGVQKLLVYHNNMVGKSTDSFAATPSHMPYKAENCVDVFAYVPYEQQVNKDN